MPPLVAGRLLLDDHDPEGWLELEGGRVVDWDEGEPPRRPDAKGWIVPSPVNAHTHVADAFLREARPAGATVAELVGPGGWKHQQLAAASPDAMADGILSYTDEMAAIGTSHFIDFREGGPAGASFLKNLAPELGATPVVLGRPATNTFDDDEARAVLAAADGVGLSGVRDFADPADLEAWAETCHRARKPFAIHVSEDRRDDIDLVLSLEPTFVVHMVQGTRSDFEQLAGEKVPVVVCPRSNRFFDLKPPIPVMIDEGVRVAVGTDNGMLADGNLLAELGQIHAWYPRLPMTQLLRMATANGRSLLGLPPALPPRKGSSPDLIVLPEQPLPAPPTTKPPLPDPEVDS